MDNEEKTDLDSAIDEIRAVDEMGAVNENSSVDDNDSADRISTASDESHPAIGVAFDSYDEAASFDLKAIIEGALFANGKPMSIKQLQALFGEEAPPDAEVIEALLREIAEDYQGRGVVLNKVASGYRFQVSKSVGPWVSRLWEEKPARYSRALLETLALIAYRQPVTRGEIEEVRGVSVSSHIVKTLMERDWIRVVGHKEVPGRPAMYATTRVFLDYFNLSNLDELPSLPDLQALDPDNPLVLEGATDAGDQASQAEGVVESEEEAPSEELGTQEHDRAVTEDEAVIENESGSETESTPVMEWVPNEMEVTEAPLNLGTPDEETVENLAEPEPTNEEKTSLFSTEKVPID